MMDTQRHALAAFQAARSHFLERRFNQARCQAREYRRLIDYRRFPMTDQRKVRCPACSIIIVIYAASAVTLECIDRLLTQGADRAEIIVVDNGNNEALHSDLAGRPLLHICCPYNFLPSEGRNVGAFFACTPALLFVDNDGLPADDYIDQALTALQPAEVIGVRGRILPRRPNGFMGPHYDMGEQPTEASFNLEGNMAIKRGIFRASGGFDPLMFGHEGHELAARCKRIKQKGQVRYWPGLLLYHDFAEGERLNAKRERQQLGEAYRAYLQRIVESLTASKPPKQCKHSGVSLVLYGVESAALTECLAPLANRAERYPLEVLLLVEDPGAAAIKQVHHWAGRLACLVLSAKCWNKPTTLASHARYQTLLLVSGTPLISPACLQTAVSVLASEQASWLDLSAVVGTRAILINKSMFSTHGKQAQHAYALHRSLNKFLAGHEEALLPNKEEVKARRHLKQKIWTHQAALALNARQHLPKSWRNRVQAPSNRVVHTTPYFRDEALTLLQPLADTDIRIAFIGTRALQEQLETVCQVRCLPCNPEKTDSKANTLITDCDLLLVESTLLSSGQHDYINASARWAACFCDSSKPSAFWYTESVTHLDLFAHLATHFDRIYAVESASTERLQNHLQSTAGEVKTLPASIAPALHNAIRQFKQPTFDNLHVLYDGWADLIEFEENRSLLQAIQRDDVIIADSLWEFSQLKLNDFPEFTPAIMGYLQPQQRRQALKEFNLLLLTSRTLKSCARLQQEIIEALAAKCRVMVFVYEGDHFDMGELNDHIEYHYDAQALRQRLQELKDNPWQCKVLTQPGWRLVCQSHTIQQRLDCFLQDAGSEKRSIKSPLVSCLTVTKRPQYITKVIQNYQRQHYPHKELMVALNRSDVDIEAIQTQIHQAIPEAQVFQIGSERNIGFCLNWLMQHAHGEYWAKMDDDDAYGPHYLQDYVLNAQALDIDLMGKKMGPTYFETLDKTLYRDPSAIPYSDFMLYEGNRHHMAGATFFGKQRLLNQNPFPEGRRSSVDVEFFRGVLAQELKILMADDFNLTVFRSAHKDHHTWKIDDAVLVQQAMCVTPDEINV
jgi:glycosyltransferase involved in cell wall biosynthesis